MKTLAMFAGQGAQYAGMGRDIASDPDAAGLFAEANRILGFDISGLCFEGPLEELTKSDRCQPATFLVSAACYTLFGKRHPGFAFDAFAGLSLGEWTALWAAGVLDFENALKVLEARGRFMQEACEKTPSGMASVMALPREAVERIASECGAYVSNVNSQMQINVAGDKAAVAKCVEAAKAAGGKALVLNVAGAFHSPLMQPAREKLAALLDSVPFSAPKAPVFSNATGAPHSEDPALIKAAMLDQITGTVRWLDCVEGSKAGFFVEFGPGKVLSGLVRRIDKASTVANVQDIPSLDTIQLPQ